MLSVFVGVPGTASVVPEDEKVNLLLADRAEDFRRAPAISTAGTPWHSSSRTRRPTASRGGHP